MKYVVRPNRVKQKMREGKLVRGFLLDVPSPELVEILGLLAGCGKMPTPVGLTLPVSGVGRIR